MFVSEDASISTDCVWPSAPRPNAALCSYQSPSHLTQGGYSGELTFKSSSSHWSHNEAFPSRGFSTVTPRMTAGNGIFWEDQNKSGVVNGLSFPTKTMCQIPLPWGTRPYHNESSVSSNVCMGTHPLVHTDTHIYCTHFHMHKSFEQHTAFINSSEILGNCALFQWFSSGILFIPVCQGLVWCMPVQILHSWFDSVSG